MKNKLLFLLVLALTCIPITGCQPEPSLLMPVVKADKTAEAVRLIEKNADANSRTSPSGWSVLHYAAMNGNVEIVQALLKAGADANYAGAKDGQANSAKALKPLSLAQGMLEVVTQIQTPLIEANLRESGLDDPALLKSATDPKAAERYQKVVDLLTTATK